MAFFPTIYTLGEGKKNPTTKKKPKPKHNKVTLVVLLSKGQQINGVSKFSQKSYRSDETALNFVSERMPKGTGKGVCCCIGTCDTNDDVISSNGPLPRLCHRLINTKLMMPLSAFCFYVI